ncbi:hypothetical protein [Nocardia brasiliensis]|uniref:Membrane protein,putative glycosyl transferase domain protein n=1 Tax=Nocardia brasiliensis (strain ATCC 700358 / HUJEG-1) TaxID=1133849 RepID=K0ESM8_NOCB7|nr:hypothetical protein [Nocardia brasiliensis]AFT99804.1 membrane protein,putative glycosyl transferase domain protein [Nocardia brasiliensis ATCC 700358]OCF87456.1 hypothetical protein AW168_26175 [Nocardia brasiliensis]
MSSNYQPPAGWSPPGTQFQTRSGFGRTLIGSVVGLVVTPIGIGLAAHGALDTRQWVLLGTAADRWGSNFQIIGGAVLLFLVAALAAFSPVGTVIAGLVWGLIPGLLQILFPEDTYRQIENLPELSDDFHLALHNWVLNGFALITGLFLIGAGIAATLRRK